MSTIANNGSAGAKYTAGAPLDEFTFGGWVKMSEASFSPSRAIFTLWFGSDRDSTIRVDANNGGAVYISAINYGGQYVYKGDAPGYYDVWFHYVATLDGAGNFRLLRRGVEDTEYEEWFTTTTGDLTDFGLFISQWDEQISACSARSVRLYSTLKTELEMLGDSLEVTASLGDLVVACADGATPAVGTYAASMTSSFGTAVEDADDPIEASGGSTETLTVTGASISGTTGAASLALRVIASGATSSASPGSVFARQIRRESVTGAASSASAGVVFARTLQRLTVTGVSSAASTGTIRTACTLNATGAACSASAGQASAVSDGSLQITGASCTATPGQAYARLTQRFVVTGAACTSTAGDASARQVTALVVTGATAASASGAARHALTLRATGDSCTASGGLASVSDGFTPVTWETSEITLHVATVQAYTRTSQLDLSAEMQPLACASRVGALGAYVQTRNLELSYL